MVAIHRTLAMDYIEGRHYQSFDEMTPGIKISCLEVVQSLHTHRVLHGDLEAWNFIISKNSDSRNILLMCYYPDISCLYFVHLTNVDLDDLRTLFFR